MTIGVITHWRSDDNYGQTLQAYALQAVLREMGHKPFLIRYISNNGSIRWRLKNKLKSLISFQQILQRKKAKHKNVTKEVSRGAQAFLQKHITLSDEVFTRKSILNSPPEADIFITGSDQVWNKLDGSYFLDFIKAQNVKKISYAASFGGIEYSGLDAVYITKWLKSFSAISVRELDGLQQCQRLGAKPATLVPDPTLLLPSATYKELTRDTTPNNNKYIFVYLLGSKICFDVDLIYSFAKERGLDVVYVASQGMDDDYTKIYPDISQWLSLISNAEYVVTNSFHGTVFSLIFNRQFITIPLSYHAARMNGRMETLLNKFNLKERLTNNLSILTTDISYMDFQAMLNAYRKEGIEFLNNSINQ
ncbi:MAG: polysaccharide pyruvyl transferase family protein [Bacteroides sp.]|nr:polysaccharide pyruvyl transferase family protein [Bacteroides sp.]